MSSFARCLYPIRLAVGLGFLLAGSLAHATDTSAVSSSLPVAAPKSPARADVVTFNMFNDGENHKLVVTLGGPLDRVDAIEDRYSVIYNPRTQDYIGLEHSNDTYWEFSWPDVKAKVSQTKRYENHLRDLLSQGVLPDDNEGISGNTTSTNTDDTSSAGAGPDSSGYIWKQTGEHRKIGGLECVHWTGQSTANPNVDAWCYAGPLPEVSAAMKTIRDMNEPMALVPVRTLVPAFLFIAYDSLVKGGSTPVLVTWGGDVEKNKFSFAEKTSRDNKPELFSIPKLYIKTTLITMDGITQPPGGGN
jgi:hypothetical protein